MTLDVPHIKHRSTASKRGRFVVVADHGGHKLALEFVPRAKRIKELYVVFDGQRIAYRSDDATWVSIVPGYVVVDDPYPDRVSVYFNGKALH